MKAMIFAAGMGTRLKPFTDSHPKALLPINGHTLLEYQIQNLKNVGINDIVINVYHFAHQIIEYLKENNNFGCQINISHEQTLLNTGGGLKYALHLLGNNDAVLACNVDILSNLNISNLIESHNPSDAATLVVSERQTSRYLLFNNDQLLKGWINISSGSYKPSSLSNNQIQNLQPLAFSGCQIISPALLEEMDSLGDEFSIIDLYLSVCGKMNIRAYVPKDYQMIDVGKIGVLKDAEEFAKTLTTFVKQ